MELLRFHSLKKSLGIRYNTFKEKCLRPLALFIFVLVTCPALGQAKQKKLLTPADYPLWGTLLLENFSEKGKWVSYSMQYEQKTDTLFIQNTLSKEKTSFPSGSNGKFSNENYFACSTPSGLQLVNLSTAKVRLIPNILDFAFTSNGKYLLTLRNDTSNKKTLEIRASNGKLIQEIPNIVSFHLNQTADKALCFLESQTKSSVILLNLGDLLTQKTIAHDSASAFKNGTWDSYGNSIAFFQETTGNSIEKQILLCYYSLKDDKLFSFSLDRQNTIPKEMEIDLSGKIKLTISDDSQRVFFGIKDKTLKDDKNNSDNVQIWKTTDSWIYPRQKSIKNWTQTVKTALWRPYKNSCFQITTNELPKLMLDGKQHYAILYNPMSLKPQYKYNDNINLYVKNLETGNHSLWFENHSGDPNHTLASPNGKHIVYFKDKNWWLFNFTTQTHHNLTENLGVAFENTDYDNAGEIPAFGVAGWTQNDKSILIYDKYDIWEISPEGKKAERLTKGREKQISFRIPQKMDGTWNQIIFDGTISSEIDLNKGVLLQAKGDNLYSGYFIWNRKQKEKAIVYSNSQIDQLIKASKSNTYIYRRQNYDSPPSLRIKRESQNKSYDLVKSNPQHSKFLWGKSELIYYKNKKGQILKAILYYPADYDSQKKYPLIAHIYERKSQELHHYINPSEMDSTGFNITNFISQGYFVLLPDIHYEIGNPGISAVDCVVSATQTIIEKGLVQSNKIGLIGHSFGGYETSFIITQTNIFAAAIAGAPATDLTSWYLTVGWNTGRPEIWRFENQQWRMGKSLFEDMEAYNRNSPILHSSQIKTPLLIWTGENDKQVNSSQSFELYLALRRLDKKAIMLVYPKERHAIMKETNQKDLTKKIQNWFDYYLKDMPAEFWMQDTDKE